MSKKVSKSYNTLKTALKIANKNPQESFPVPDSNQVTQNPKSKVENKSQVKANIPKSNSNKELILELVNLKKKLHHFQKQSSKVIKQLNGRIVDLAEKLNYPPNH